MLPLVSHRAYTDGTDYTRDCPVSGAEYRSCSLKDQPPADLKCRLLATDEIDTQSSARYSSDAKST